MKDKKLARMRRAAKTRARIAESGRTRLCVHRTPRHIYAQIITPDGSQTLLSASSLDKEIRAELKSTGNCETASVVGKALAERALSAGIKEVAFDRSGFRYHGRIRALAEAAREAGLQF
jgi:large subunit ribosomal protein L18